MGSDLLALAQDAGARDELASRLTRMRRAEMLGDGARAELEALLRELRHQVSPPMRASIDAELRRAPSGAVSPAAPRLSQEAPLSEDDLARLATQVSASRLVTLAKRPELSARVSGLIAARGQALAMRALVGNRGPHMARSTLIAFVELAFADPTLRSLLIRRSDLPEEAIGRLWPHLSDGDKAVLLVAGAPYDEREAREIAAEAELRLHGALRRGELPESVDAIEAILREGQASLDGAVEHLCRGQRLADLAELLARRLSAPWPPCLNLLAMPSSRGAALLCRAAGLSRQSHERIALLRRDLGHQPARGGWAGRHVFDTLSRKAARRLLAAYEAASPARFTKDWR